MAKRQGHPHPSPPERTESLLSINNNNFPITITITSSSNPIPIIINLTPTSTQLNSHGILYPPSNPDDTFNLYLAAREYSIRDPNCDCVRFTAITLPTIISIATNTHTLTILIDSCGNFFRCQSLHMFDTPSSVDNAAAADPNQDYHHSPPRPATLPLTICFQLTLNRSTFIMVRIMVISECILIFYPVLVTPGPTAAIPLPPHN